MAAKVAVLTGYQRIVCLKVTAEAAGACCLKSIFGQFAFFWFFIFQISRQLTFILYFRLKIIKVFLLVLFSSKVVQKVNFMLFDRICDVFLHDYFVIQFLSFNLWLWKICQHFQCQLIAKLFYYRCIFHVGFGKEEQFLWNLWELGVRVFILGLVKLDFFHKVLPIIENLFLEKGDELTFILLSVLAPVKICSNEEGVVMDF